MKLFNPKSESRFLYTSKTGSMGNINYGALENWQINFENQESNVIKLFYGAAFNDQLHFVIEGLDASIPPDVVNEDGITLITAAARGGAIKTLKYLIKEKKFNPAELNESQRHNALHAACVGGQFDAVRYLLKAAPTQLHIDMPEPEELQSPLQTAISELQFECAIQIITQLKPNLLHTDKFGRTPLVTLFSCNIPANSQQQFEDVGLLLLQNENPFYKVNDSVNPVNQMIENSLTAYLLATPKLAVALYKIAEKNPSGVLEDKYLKQFKLSIQELSEEKKAELIRLYNEEMMIATSSLRK